ncbi:DNA helicase II/ATP-dependent DNA helicase PcrA [Cryptococcus wingfieldii CBS 7118]|uniref:DNA 3'-5' helicase n=1 Tax=Cryptococcus wingfieldii CBS 7118 TaxID=1295528 RepID=A0A1E3I5V3_9TREE|nr:DNA helicase II/ATP-dependent DNA helicase PcrA [Cryptococcus wingfieldii CBS 7118]ODN83942.1 DNA helicase II/ATP-dependent DNA helicase PcrA [Cryptococcus wingfieldii CBS 7118]
MGPRRTTRGSKKREVVTDPEEAKPQYDLVQFPYLATLNDPQALAVTATPSTPLQILAGPGSGKTRVLTSRVAYLVQHYGYLPREIVAVTFTNKSASEMRNRLKKLLGEEKAGQLILGTFHSTCVKYLRRFGKIIDLPNNFVIADADDCKKLIANMLKERKEQLAENSMSIKEGAVLSEISNAKAKGESPEEMAVRARNDKNLSTSTLLVISQLYQEYQVQLRESNSLDFDDLLVYALRLFTEAPRVVEDVKHILVDEFQDTNITQYELLKCFAKAHMGVSVVGDPDQSIYGWRASDIENLNKMYKDFPGVEAIYLEENYRSTGAILDAAHAVVSQDSKRIQKSLFTSHPQSTPVILKTFATPTIESSFISSEIKRLIAYSGGMLKFDDFAILLRYNALSRVIESALQKDSVPNKIVGGHKFFERMEVKDLLAYLQLADNPGFNPAFMRVINALRAITDGAKKDKITPMELCERITDGERLPEGIKPNVQKNLASFVGAVRKLRRVAEKGTTVSGLLKMAIEKTGYENHLRTSQQDFDSRWENVKELVSPHISYSVTVAEEQNRASENRESRNSEDLDDIGFQRPSTAVVEAVANKAYDEEKAKEEKKLHPMFARSRSRSGSVSGSRSASVSRKTVKTKEGEDGVVELLDSEDEEDAKPKQGLESVSEEVEPKTVVKEEKVGNVEEVSADLVEELANAPENLTPLAYFLQVSMLSTDTESEEQQENSDTPRVTITTVHAAKGLEWPVVFIPAVEQGTFPSYRCTEEHEIAEERRLLYVAMTRAQCFLTLSHCNFRMMGGEDKDKQLSEFVSDVQRKLPGTFVQDLPKPDVEARKRVSTMLERPLSDEADTTAMIMKHVRAAPPMSTWDAPESDNWGGKINRFARREVTKTARSAEYWASGTDDYALPGSAGSSTSGFQTARSSMSQSRPPFSSEPKKPPPRPVNNLSANRNLPTALPFTFNTTPQQSEEASLGSFMSGSNKGLEMMAGLGGLPPAETPVSGASAAGARGTKRLGMGRPAPWGSKKSREE